MACHLYRVGPSIPARPRPAKDGQPYLETKAYEQKETGGQMIGMGLLCMAAASFLVSGLPLNLASAQPPTAYR